MNSREAVRVAGVRGSNQLFREGNLALKIGISQKISRACASVSKVGFVERDTSLHRLQ